MRAIIAIPCLVIAVLIGVYIGYNVPHERDQEVIERFRLNHIELARRCSEDGMRYFKDFFDKAHDNSYQRWDSPEFHFNSKLNSCLVYIRYVQYFDDPTLRVFHHNYVIDVYSNHHVVDGYFTSDPGFQPTNEKVEEPEVTVPNYGSREFSAQKKKLFGE